MAEVGQRLQSGESDPDFEPFCRPRSCTWPLRRPELGEPGGSPPPAGGPDKRELDFMGGLSLALLEETETEEKQEVQQVRQVQPLVQVQLQVHAQDQVQPLSSSASTPSSVSPSSSSSASAQRKSSSCRRNAWGNMSYADLITQAIESSPDRRLTLAQIYEWMVKSVPYFKDKGDSNSSAGWKNSIRHNLSLHSRFIRVQNEGTGKSSWWMLNPDGGKNGKSPRRRAASMDNNSKFIKSRGRAAKKKVAMQGGLDGVSNSPAYSKWLGSPNSHSNDDFETWNSFRTRASSDASTLSGRRSPFLPEEEVGEGEIHMVYQGTKLPSLSEVSDSFSGKNVMMENLLDNLNLLSPKTGAQEASHAQFSPYSSGSDFHKWQSGVSLPASEGKAGGYSPYPGQFNCSTGLLKELLSNEAEQRGDVLPPMEGVEHRQGAGGRLHAPYGVQGHIKAPGPHTHSSTLVGMNGCTLPPPGHPDRHGNMKPYPHLPHLGGGAVEPAPPSYCMVSINGYHRPAPAVPNHHHHHHHHHREHQHYHNPLERLPSDLDDMAIERLECDVESVLHDALMDGDALDFNFDQQGFSHSGVKNNTHSWVSG